MITIVLIIHVFIVIALVGVVLLQRSDGGALGIGGGGGGASNFMTGRGAANTLTRLTTILGALFITTSLGLGIFGPKPVDSGDIARELTGDEDTLLAPAGDEDVSAEDLLQGFGEGTDTPSETEDLLSLPPVPETSSEEGEDDSAEEEPQPEDETPQ